MNIPTSSFPTDTDQTGILLIRSLGIPPMDAFLLLKDLLDTSRGRGDRITRAKRCIRLGGEALADRETSVPFSQAVRASLEARKHRRPRTLQEIRYMAARMMKGKFDLEDLLSQLRQIQKLGSLGGIMGMIPGLSKFKNQIADAGIGDALIKKQEAIILSMTKAERKNPDIIKASRKKRIAAGSGVEVHDVNKLLKQYEQMASMMKKMGRGGGFGGLASMMKNVPFGKFPGGTGNKFPF